MATRTPRGTQQALDTSSLDQAGPLEQLARIAGGTSFREPTLGRSTAPLSQGEEDVPHALSHIKDELAQHLTLAIVYQTAYDWPKIQLLAQPRILEALHNTASMRDLVTDHRQYRVRIVLYDAFHDRALLRPYRAWKEAAATARMNESAYTELYRWIAGFIDTVATAGAIVACRALKGRTRP